MMSNPTMKGTNVDNAEESAGIANQLRFQTLIARHSSEFINLPPITDPKFPSGGCHYWRRDDVSAPVYFYLDKPENNLPPLAEGEMRTKNRSERVWSRT